MKINNKKLNIIVLLAILIVGFSGCKNQEKIVDLGDGWQSYQHKKIGLTVRVPADAMIKIGSKWTGEAPINNVWFSEGLFNSIESDKYIGVGTLIRGDANMVREKLIKYSATNGEVVDQDDINITVQRFYVENVPVFFVCYDNSRMDVYVAGDKYLHYAKINRDFLQQYYAEVNNLSDEIQKDKYVEILKKYILAVDPF